MTSQIQYYVINGYEVDVYAVGWLRAIHLARKDRRFRRKLRFELNFALRMARQRNWRAVKNTFNGYLAEPRVFPHGVHRCGHGWTRRRALRDLRRLMREAGY